ncbi:lysophospholipid acyltransferase family protein [Flavisolibacter ginsenosidimutans]|uniref:1-acyl-sn-glycerol-3-phosphate acyltransferase n=1 Tax=Flavisolibacter ginsenosidimutans TaxID=661481 RepID=A0A5B8UGG8_9BACT|nr:lysophospholipid acyltransferase family protein [Flavisolibacter ginsenosidimutans]QEC55465.1 1-acyl-sn-glycerol-3-phosphate acyltransferase [Flavisolibacter ginsenosidimutans]
MRILLKSLQCLYVLYAFALFLVLMLPVFLWSLFATFFGKIKGGNLVYQACVIWADIWFPLVFIFHKNVYLQKPKEHCSYIFVANHISYLDAAVIPKTFRHPVRPLGKVEMAKIPVFGTIYKNAIVTVDRSSAGNRARSVQILKSVLRKEISVLVFPEGTFNMSHEPLKDFYDGAFRIAIETGTPIMPVLFLNTYDRMDHRSVFSLNPGKSRSVFLPEVSVEGLTPKDVGELKAKVFRQMSEALIERNASWIKA